MGIDISVTEEFSEKDAKKILAIAKEYFTVETLNDLMGEFGFEYPEDTFINIRNADGEETQSFRGNCYDDLSIRTIPADYEEYKWEKYMFEKDQVN